MFCQKCGTKNEDNSKFCNSCGESFTAETNSKNEIHKPVNVNLQETTEKIKEQFNSTKQEISGVKSAADVKKLILSSRRVQIILGVVSLIIIISIIFVVRACSSGSGVNYYAKWKNVDYSELNYVQFVTGVQNPQAYAIINILHEDNSIIDYIEEYDYTDNKLMNQQYDYYLITSTYSEYYILSIMATTKSIKFIQDYYTGKKIYGN